MSVSRCMAALVRPGWLRITLVPTIFWIFALGCNSAPKMAIEDHAGQHQAGMKLTLTASEQRQVYDSLANLAADHTQVRTPASAPNGIRWSDLAAALDAACDELEMAPISSRIDDDLMTFTLKTIDDRRGWITMTRTDDVNVYRADATIGLHQPDEARAAELIRALRNQAKAFGRKRSYKTE